MGDHTLLGIANRSIELILNCNVKSDVIWCLKTQQSDVNATDPSANTAFTLHHKHMKLVKPFTRHVIARSIRKGFWSVDL